MKKRRFKKTQSFLIITISLSIAVFPACLHYYNLVEADFLSPTLSFENPDQENLPIIHLTKLKASGLSGFPAGFLQETFLCEQITCLAFQTQSLCQKTPVLRC
jgi:hypothetical protein